MRLRCSFSEVGGATPSYMRVAHSRQAQVDSAGERTGFRSVLLRSAATTPGCWFSSHCCYSFGDRHQNCVQGCAAGYIEPSTTCGQEPEGGAQSAATGCGADGPAVVRSLIPCGGLDPTVPYPAQLQRLQDAGSSVTVGCSECSTEAGPGWYFSSLDDVCVCQCVALRCDGCTDGLHQTVGTDSQVLGCPEEQDGKPCSGRLVVVSAVARRLWSEMDERRAAGDLDAWVVAGFPRSWHGAQRASMQYTLCRRCGIGSRRQLGRAGGARDVGGDGDGGAATVPAAHDSVGVTGTVEVAAVVGDGSEDGGGSAGGSSNDGSGSGMQGGGGGGGGDGGGGSSPLGGSAPAVAVAMELTATSVAATMASTPRATMAAVPVAVPSSRSSAGAGVAELTTVVVATIVLMLPVLMAVMAVLVITVISDRQGCVLATTGGRRRWQWWGTWR